MIGVGIITCDRPDFFRKCYNSIELDMVDKIVIIDDGATQLETVPCGDKIIYIRHDPGRQGVGVSKAVAIDKLMEIGCYHLFLIEDDMIIKDNDVFRSYIFASAASGIEHFMFGYHGPANKNGISGGLPIAKYQFRINNDLVIAINTHCVGSFCYYTRNCIVKVGNYDTEFRNAFEHIEHSHRIAEAGLTTPYWNWADIANSPEYIGEQACSEHNSSIRSTPEWSSNIEHGINHFILKHNMHPFQVPDKTAAEIKQILLDIYNGK